MNRTKRTKTAVLNGTMAWAAGHLDVRAQLPGWASPWAVDLVRSTIFDNGVLSASLVNRGDMQEYDKSSKWLIQHHLLAVSRSTAVLRYNDPKLFQLLGGRKAMIESPVL